MYAYTAELPEDAKNIVLNMAGRMNGGDFEFSFNNTIEDDNKLVIPALNQALINYETYNGPYNGTGTNIEFFTFSDQINLFPNPVVNELSISTTYSINSIKIYSFSGILVYSFSGNTRTINMSDFYKGMYVIRISTNNGDYQQKIMKK
ncbi:MAG: T9SS type A sorting domain-containing protein [Marinilabiliaceae bacterium]|nr:T9SS type A sorting domain-containing protein [Marinilabiliaceae bacterium]